MYPVNTLEGIEWPKKEAEADVGESECELCTVAGTCTKTGMLGRLSTTTVLVDEDEAAAVEGGGSTASTRK